MKDLRIDPWGRQRCWNCGGINFTTRRTARSWVWLGPFALLTKPKQRCNRCSAYNDVGSAQPYNGPADKRYQLEFEREVAAAQQSAPQIMPGSSSGGSI